MNNADAEQRANRAPSTSQDSHVRELSTGQINHERIQNA
jgi:hypothetical protein